MTTSAEIRQQLGAALDFQCQLQAYGAITGRRKLPWRYRWPDAVRDDVLPRLLALNAERYAEDQSQSLMVGSRKKLSGRNKQLSKLDLSTVCSTELGLEHIQTFLKL